MFVVWWLKHSWLIINNMHWTKVSALFGIFSQGVVRSDFLKLKKDTFSAVLRSLLWEMFESSCSQTYGHARCSHLKGDQGYAGITKKKTGQGKSTETILLSSDYCPHYKNNQKSGVLCPKQTTFYWAMGFVVDLSRTIRKGKGQAFLGGSL